MPGEHRGDSGGVPREAGGESRRGEAFDREPTSLGTTQLLPDPPQRASDEIAPAIRRVGDSGSAVIEELKLPKWLVPRPLATAKDVAG